MGVVVASEQIENESRKMYKYKNQKKERQTKLWVHVCISERCVNVSNVNNVEGKSAEKRSRCYNYMPRRRYTCMNKNKQ